jgi:hypothetical protein
MKDIKDIDAMAIYNTDDFSGVNVIVFSEKDFEKEKPKLEGKMAEKLDIIEKDVDGLKKENIKLKVLKFMEENKEKILPTIAPLVQSLLIETLDDGKVIKFSEENKEKEFSLGLAIAELISRLPKYVEFVEKGKGSGDIEGDKEDKDLAKIKKYAEDNKVSLEDARVALTEKGEIDLVEEQ